MLNHTGVTRREKVCKKGKKPQTRAYTLATCPKCGNQFEALLDNIKKGNTKSCGCWRTENKHLYNSRTYKSWQGIKDRCTNKNLSCYQNYGGRGISFDPSWEYFDNFLEDMGICPPNMSIERIDNDGNYSKDNCRWASYEEQANNRRSSLYVEYNGKEDTLANWCRKLNLNYKSTWAALKKGKTLYELIQPQQRNRAVTDRG